MFAPQSNESRKNDTQVRWHKLGSDRAPCSSGADAQYSGMSRDTVREKELRRVPVMLVML